MIVKIRIKLISEINVVAVSAILDVHKSGRLSVITDGGKLMSSCYAAIGFCCSKASVLSLIPVSAEMFS